MPIKNWLRGKLKDVLLKTRQYLKHNREEEVFVQKMQEVKPLVLYTNLSAKFPNLTTNELKLCALLRLRLSSKEIASINNITAKSVDMNRYRLRKKFGIEQHQDVNEILALF